MEITYLKLVNFRRMPLLDIEIFEHEFKTKLITIIGGNGVGKTSLINELTPLPADKANFYKNGYKEIHIKKENRLYKLISDFRNGSHFSFLIDDEEHNLSNNVTTQKELAFFYFNITPIIHEILIGNETFTDMSLLTRKKLFSEITHLNIDKVLDNYNTLKEELKSNELLLKTQTTLYQTEEQKLINTSHLSSLKENIDRTKKHIDFLLDTRTYLYSFKNNSSLDITYTKVKELLDKINLAKNKYYTLIVNYPNKEIEKYKLKYSSELNIVTYQINELYSSLEKSQQELKILELNKKTDLIQVNKRLEELKVNKKKFIDSLVFLKDTTINIEHCKNEIYKLEVSLPDILTNIKTNEVIDNSRKFTKEKYDKLLDDKNLNLNSLTELTTKELSLIKEIKEITDTNDDITCPKCTHTWSLKDKDSTLLKLKTELQNKLLDKVKVQTSLKQINTDIDELVEYFNHYKNYSTVKKYSYETLKSFWNFIDSSELFFTNPKSILTYINKLNLDISYVETIENINKEINSIEENLKILSSMKDSSYDKIEENINDLSIIIDDMYQYKTSIQNTLDNISKAVKLYTYSESLRTLLEASVIDLFSNNVSYTISDILNSIESDLSKYKIILIESEKELTKYENIQYTLEKYKKTIEDTSTNIKVLNILLNELSPKNGLIAKSVSSFLNMIITNVNKTIANIWSYKMVLKTIDVESDTLNYKFKVEVEDKLVIDDIKLCSKGMQKLINFCFVRVLYKLLGLEGYPLYLDEFNTNLDKEHSLNFSRLVKNILDAGTHSQIFIISHLSNDYFFKEEDIDYIDLN